MNVSFMTWQKRVSRGMNPEMAAELPSRKPLWMHKIELEEGRPLREILQEEAKAAEVTGYSCTALAKEWGVKKDTLGYWARRWGIHFPKGNPLGNPNLNNRG